MKFLPTINDVFDDFFYEPFQNRSTVNVMRTDISESNDQYILNMELPGFKKEDIQMELKDGYLMISATKNESKEAKDSDGRVIRRERYTGSCSRNFYVGDIRQEDIRASFENGELKVFVPKENVKRVEEKKYITIE
ncbi:MAG: Hsp20/alpha crystallin family protein [Faecalibacillus sp.]